MVQQLLVGGFDRHEGGFLLRAKLRDPSYYVVVPVLEDAASDAPC